MGLGTEQGRVRESPYETVGKVEVFPAQAGMSPPRCLNECPYGRVGKFITEVSDARQATDLNESPSKKEGKYRDPTPARQIQAGLNESPSKKKGKFR